MAYGDGTKSGGRKPGSRNKPPVTEAMRRDILAVYKKLGGRKFLAKFAEENPAEFLKQCLSRVMPAPPKEDGEPSVTVNNNFSDLDVARRIAFVLHQGKKQLEETEPEAIEAKAEPVTLPAPAPVAQPLEAATPLPAPAPRPPHWPPAPPPPPPPLTVDEHRARHGAEMGGKPSTPQVRNKRDLL
jgi:hypothetical protein